MDAFLFIPGHSKFLRMGIGSFYFCLFAVIIIKNQSSPFLTPTSVFVFRSEYFSKLCSSLLHTDTTRPESGNTIMLLESAMAWHSSEVGTQWGASWAPSMTSGSLGPGLETWDGLSICHKSEQLRNSHIYTPRNSVGSRSRFFHLMSPITSTAKTEKHHFPSPSEPVMQLVLMIRGQNATHSK